MGEVNRRAVTSLVRALARALKAAGYYDPGHPILQQLYRALHDSLKETGQGTGEVTIACAGATLLIGESEKPLGDEVAKGFATHLFSRSIVAFKLAPGISLRDLGCFMQALAESPDRLRQVGGLRPLLQQQGAKGVELFEVDFADLFSGKKTDIGGEDPLVQLALQELLRFKQNKERTGTALGISLSQIGSPQSLGALLDELLESAAPGIVVQSKSGAHLGVGGARELGTGPDGRAGAQRGALGRTGAPGGGGGRGVRGSGAASPGALSGLSGEELAELAAQAFLGTCEKVQAQAGSETLLSETAQVLTKALVRLNPEARFSLSRQLAGAEKAGTGGTGGVKSLSSQLKDDLIIEAMASVLSGQKADGEMIASVSALVRQLRPIESERRRLLETLDQTLRGQGQPMEGMLWQELQASALGTNGLGMLEISFRQNQQALAERAKARIKNGSNPPDVQQVLATLDPLHRAARSAKLLAELLPAKDELTPAMTSMAKDILEGVDAAEGGSSGEHLKLLEALLKRADAQSPSAPLPQTVRELLSGPKGISRAIALVNSSSCKASPNLAQALLQALDSPLTLDARRELVAAFSSLDESTLRGFRARVSDAKPIAVFQIVVNAIRAGPTFGVEAARQALRNRALKSKESALRALATLAQPQAVVLLSKAAGCEGDPEAAKVFSLEESNPAEREQVLSSLQRTAIEALGQMRSELSVPSLETLLYRRKLVGNSSYDLLVPYVAQALVINGTPAARRALDSGKASKHKTIRDACVRAG